LRQPVDRPYEVASASDNMLADQQINLSRSARLMDRSVAFSPSLAATVLQAARQ
jgi:hypothetical protein